MNKKSLLTLLILAAQPLFAQEITTQDIATFHNVLNADPNAKTIQNVVMSTSNIKSLVLDNSVTNSIDHIFKYRVNVSGITNQQHSGRCWMFTSLNVLRPIAIQKFNVRSFQFSQNYLYFFDILEKSNLFLENIIRTKALPITDNEVVFYLKDPISDGGVWNHFYNIATKYGVVPSTVMPETVHSNNTAEMLDLLNERLRSGACKLRSMSEDSKNETSLRKEKLQIMKDVYRLLSLCLGEPPMQQFTWRYITKNGEAKSLTTSPKEFYESIVPADYSANNYIMIMNDPTRPYYQTYEIANYRNAHEGMNWIYLNLPNADIKQAALKSIKNNEALYASCDVNKQLNITSGIMAIGQYNYNALLNINTNTMDKKERILTRQSGSSHAMALVGCDTDENDTPTKWQFENSWGNTGNNGYLTFTDEWFNEYLFRIVINKKYLNNKAIDSLKKKPELLPAWDYMF